MKQIVTSSGFARPLVLSAVLGVAGCGNSGSSGSVINGEPPKAYAYITSADVQGRPVQGAVYQYAIASDGSLAPLSVASVPAGVSPSAVIADPGGRYVYVANAGDETISQYAVGGDGSLMPLAPATVNWSSPGGASIGTGYALTVDPHGRFLYVVIDVQDPVGPDGPSYVAQFAIGAGGTLAALSPAQVMVPVIATGSLEIDASGQYAYLAGNAATVAQLSIAADGTLSLLAPATVAASQTPTGIAIAPDGRTAYVLSRCVDTVCDGQVASYTIGANGTLAPTNVSVLTGSHVNPVAMLTEGSISTPSAATMRLRPTCKPRWPSHRAPWPRRCTDPASTC
jgi:6-phosphogluconolactonase (cycloisomerase 2 family)